MNVRLRTAIITGAVCACVGVCGGYFLRWSTQPPTLTVGNGKIEVREVIKYVADNGSMDCDTLRNKYNSLYYDFVDYLNARPVALSTANDKITFKIREQIYSLPYTLPQPKPWGIMPIVSARIRFTPAVGVPFDAAIGAGVAADYYGFGGGIIVGGLWPSAFPDVNIFVYYRF